MNLVFNADDVYLKVYESLQEGARSRELTADWLYVKDVSFTFGNKVKTTPQIGFGSDKDEVIGDDLKLNLGVLDTGTDFDFAASTTIKYLIDLYYYDETAQQTLTYTLYACTPVNSGLTNGYSNKIAREWKVGSYVRA